MAKKPNKDALSGTYLSTAPAIFEDTTEEIEEKIKEVDVKIKDEYYRLTNILKRAAHYYIIFGLRSNGKSYAVLERALRRFWEEGAQLGYIRRQNEDLKGKRAGEVWANLVTNGLVKKVTKGRWNNIIYKSGKWYLCNIPDNTEEAQDEDIEVCNKPLAYAFTLSGMEHDKSSSYPGIKMVVYEEFITRKQYLVDEFVTFCNVLSTIVRRRGDVEVFMIGNTVNQFCPYFREMGLTNVKKMKPGDIDVYKYGESGLTVAVEYSDAPPKKAASDVYFAFDNPKLNMITNGAWELDIYPHLPEKYNIKDIVFNYFINFDNEMLQADIIVKKDKTFTYIHRKSTEIKKPKEDIIYSLDYDPRPNHFRKIHNPQNKIQKKIWDYFKKDLVFYQDNEVGEIVRNYLLNAGKV